MMISKFYGPPGTGKTQTLMDIFERALGETSPDRIAFLTFTRSAREEAYGERHIS